MCFLDKGLTKNILAIIGILVTGFAIAICQITKMRSTFETLHKDVKKSQKQIRQTLDLNEIGRGGQEFGTNN